MLVCSLIDGEQSVGALAELLGVSKTLASQHLGLLRRDGEIATRRDGQRSTTACKSAAPAP